MITVYGLNIQRFNADRGSAFFKRVQAEHPDAICLQETGRAADAFPPYARLEGYHIASSYEPNAPGTSGVAVLSAHEVREVTTKFCDDESCRGRFVEVLTAGIRIASVYAHAHNAKDSSRWAMRQRFNTCLGGYMRRRAGEPCIIVTDANVALTRADVAKDTQWTGPWANAGEGKYRKPIVDAMDEAGWRDSYRAVHGDQRRATVWYSAKSFAGNNGVDEGYGIDFQLVSAPLAAGVREAEVVKANSWDERFSDHALTIGKYEI